MFSAFSISATHYILGLANTLPDNIGKKELYRNIVRKVTNDMQPGDSFHIINAYDMKTIMSIELPVDQAYENSKVKKKFSKKSLSKLKKHLKQPESEKSNDEINFPRFTKHVSTLVTDHLPSPKKIAVLVIGNALYLEKRESESFSFKDGWFPSDGHIGVSEKTSPFGTLGKLEYLNNYSIGMLYTNREFVSPLYKYRINRFWSLFTKSQGGELSTFTDDFTVAFNRFGPDFETREVYAFDNTLSKIEMLRASRTRKEVNSKLSSNSNFMSEGTVSEAPPLVGVGKIKLGIRWDNCKKCDLDLYAKSSNESFLSFKNRKTSSGLYFKDFTSNPEAKNGLEYIIYNKPVKLDDLKVFINLYAKPKGDDKPSGVIRAFFNNNIYESRFEFDSNKGNSGKGYNRIKDEDFSNPNWIRVDMMKLFNLSITAGI
jgi:hypothetical protein